MTAGRCAPSRRCLHNFDRRLTPIATGRAGQRQGKSRAGWLGLFSRQTFFLSDWPVLPLAVPDSAPCPGRQPTVSAALRLSPHPPANYRKTSGFLLSVYVPQTTRGQTGNVPANYL